ncbi:hypothetical protein [Leptospira selangorensis]|nr:hypothetical protein [Leptospira selangorensis]
MDPILIIVIVSGFSVGIVYGLWIRKRHKSLSQKVQALEARTADYKELK